MKKVLLGLTFLGLACASQAAPLIACTPAQVTAIDNGTIVAGGVVFTCPNAFNNVTGDLINVNSVQLFISGSVQNNNGVSGSTYAGTFTVTANSLGIAGLNGLSCTASGVTNDQLQAVGICSQLGAVINVAPVDALANNFTVTVLGSDADGGGPQLLPFNGSTSVSYQVTSGVPEPGSMVLLGSGLIGLGFLARRRKRS